MKRFTFMLCIICALLSQVFAGEYITYTDPKTGVRYFGDSLPPSTPRNVKIEIKHAEPISTVGHSSNWNEAAKGIAPKVPVRIEPKPVVEQPQQQQYQAYTDSYSRASSSHQFNKPTPPSRDRTARDFNRGTNAWGKYEADMFEWQSQGRDLRQQYNAPIGFGRYPTGFSQEEKQYYKSYGR